MSYRLDDVIVALASPPGGAARAVLRLSGQAVTACVAAAFEPDEACDLFSIRRPTAVCGVLRLRSGGPPLPCELYLWPTPRSFTGEPAAEIHMLGSPPLVEAAIRSLVAAGARPAERGEFTLRAFLGGRLDLTQAEAVLGAVDAADDRELDAALGQLAGGLAGPLRRLRESLLELLVEVEAGLDFPEEDLAVVSPEEIDRQLAAASAAVAGLARQMQTRHTAGELVRAVLVGWPNVGKSSLFNALLGRTGALVSELPATTRDYLTAELDLGGAKCLLVDTAGVEIDPAGPAAAIRRAAQDGSARQSDSAGVELLCLDTTRPLNSWERARLAADNQRRIAVLTKIDAAGATDFAGHAVRTSSFSGWGLDVLRDRLHRAVLAARPPGGVVRNTAVRCHDSLRRAVESLALARQVAAEGGGEELVAAELRAALDELGQVVGAVYTDDLLERIFSRFCIGK